jgi:CubicO group peptidase (beta-lactamase class C family)
MIADALGVVSRANVARVFPAATVDVGSSDRVLWQQAFGTLTFETSAPAELSTPFDLASLTKPLATTTVVMQLIAAGQLRLDQPVSMFIEEWRGADRAGVTVVDLLEHASGLAARLVDPPPLGQREFEHEICALPLEYAPRTLSVYSDLGFILLGFIAERAGHAPLATQLYEILAPVRPDIDLLIGLALSVRPAHAAPTLPMLEDPRRGRVLAGEVHDNYAAALGGFAGHAGLFGSAPAVGGFAQTLLRVARGDAGQPPPFAPDLLRRFVTRSEVPGSSRSLGWDTMLPSSSCGTQMSASAFGHVGYTGTSVWVDPDRDRYFVLLTNRVCGGGTLEDMRDVRRAFHDALGDL